MTMSEAVSNPNFLIILGVASAIYFTPALLAYLCPKLFLQLLDEIQKPSQKYIKAQSDAMLAQMDKNIAERKAGKK